MQRMQHPQRMEPMQRMQHPQADGDQQEWMESQRLVITRQEPSLRDCIKEMPSESELPKLGKSSDFTQFWKKFEEAAKRHAWPMALIPELISYRASDHIKESLVALKEPKSLKEAREFLRKNVFPVTDFATVRTQLLSTKQFLRESVEEWEWRLEKINDGRINLDNAEGLQMYKEAVLPVYRLQAGDTIKTYMDACKAREMRIRAAFGDQAYPSHLFQESRVNADYVEQLSSYERMLISGDERKLLERLRPEDMRPITRKVERDRINAITATEVMPPPRSRKCGFCNKNGHTTELCWNLHPELRRGSQQEGRQERRRLRLPEPQFIGQCLVCAVFHPDTPPHLVRECPFNCPNCGQGTHSVSLCPLNHGSGAAAGLDQVVDSDA
jgi:hypothetical protein